MAGNVYSLRTVEDEASEWIARTENGCTPEQRQRLEAWLNAAPEHRAVFEAMSRQWQRITAAAEVAGRLNKPSAPEQGSRDRTPGSARLLGSLAAGLLIAFGLVLYFYFPALDSPDREDVYTTDVGHHRTVRLADGSAVDLNTATRIEVVLSHRERLIRLTAGEALFRVAPNPDRPFIVMAGSSWLRALGTSFVVRLGAGTTTVLVTEGRVLVSPSQPASVKPGAEASAETNKVLGAGEQVSITTAVGSVAKIEAHDLERSLSWRRGVLNIQDQPLGEVVAEVERYSAVRFWIADPALEQIRVGGYFKATDLDAFLTLLEGQFPIRAERAGSGTIILRHRGS